MSLSRLAAWPMIAATFVFGAGIASSQTYPNKAIRFIVPFSPGGSTDFIARVTAQRLGPVLGQQVVVENRPGANGNPGTDFVAKAPADGYTLVVITLNHVTNVSLYQKLPFDPLKDFAPVTQLSAEANVLVVHPSLPAKTVKEFVALAKSKKGAMNYASSSIGVPSHLGMELFKSRAGFDAAHIPYKGAGQAIIDVLGGQVFVFIPPTVVALPHVTSGKVRGLAVTSAKRSSLLPDLPTIAESGYPGFQVEGWYGLLAPAGTPREIVSRLSEEIAKILRVPETQERIIANGIVPVSSTPEEFGSFMRAEMVKWAKVIKESGARLD